MARLGFEHRVSDFKSHVFKSPLLLWLLAKLKLIIYKALIISYEITPIFLNNASNLSGYVSHYYPYSQIGKPSASTWWSQDSCSGVSEEFLLFSTIPGEQMVMMETCDLWLT